MICNRSSIIASVRLVTLSTKQISLLINFEIPKVFYMSLLAFHVHFHFILDRLPITGHVHWGSLHCFALFLQLFSGLGDFLLAFGRKLSLMTFQTFCDPAASRLNAGTERHDIILAGLLYTLKLKGDFFNAGLSSRGKLSFVLGQAFPDSSPARLDALAELFNIPCAGFFLG